MNNGVIVLLLSHHFRDHANGNEAMAQKNPEITVIGGDSRIPALTRKVYHGDTFKVKI